MELKPKPTKPDRIKTGENNSTQKAHLIPRPQSMGAFVFLLTILAFASGWIRNELFLTLLGTVFLIIMVYCFLGVFLYGLIERRKSRSLSMAVIPEAISMGKERELCVDSYSPAEKEKFWWLPAILARYEICFKTRDARFIRLYSVPGIKNRISFSATERGAYYSGAQAGTCNNLIIFDAPGFFRLALPVHQSESACFFAAPLPAKKPVPLFLKSGAAEERNDPHYRKNDELIDHRPYVPGDDPRRINWKLYSHTHSGEFFVREGESEPPPNSRQMLLILIDTEADRALYTIEEGRRAVDLLCETALTTALDFSAKGVKIELGCTGNKITEGWDESTPQYAAKFATALSLPAAIIRLPKTNLPTAELPKAPPDRSVLIFALPRTSADSSPLDRFLEGCRQGADIVFLFDAGGIVSNSYSTKNKAGSPISEAASANVSRYNGRRGVHAVQAAVKAAKLPEAAK
jgi:hypothetical protein